MAGVLVTSGDAFCIGLGDGGGVAAHPGFMAVSAVVPCVVFPDKVVRDAGFRCVWLPLGVW